MGYKITENSPLQAVYTSLKPIELYTIRDAIEKTEKHIQKRKNCPRCNGKGFLYHTDETQTRITNKIQEVQEKIKAKNNPDNEFGQYLVSYAERIIKTAFSKGYQCTCRFKLDFYVKRQKLLSRAVNMGADIDYIYNIDELLFKDKTKYFAHMILSTFIEIELYNGYRGGAVFASVYTLQSEELDYYEFRTLMDSAYHFIYIENSGYQHKDYKFFVEKLAKKKRVIQLIPDKQAL